MYLSLNSTGTDGAAYHLREELLDEFADRYFPADPAPTPAAGGVEPATRAAHAAALAGNYESTRGFHSTFLTALGPLQPTRARVVDGDRVLFTPGPGQPTPAEYEANRGSSGRSTGTGCSRWTPTSRAKSACSATTRRCR